MWIRIYSILKNLPNTNIFGFEKSSKYEYIWFWKIIRIRILFGLKISAEYEYEYRYSVSTSQISFEHRIICSPLNTPLSLPFPSYLKYSSLLFERLILLVQYVWLQRRVYSYKLWRPLQNPNSLSDQHDFHKLTSWPTWKLSQVTKIEIRAMQSYFYKTPKNQRRLNS